MSSSVKPRPNKFSALVNHPANTLFKVPTPLKLFSYSTHTQYIQNISTPLHSISSSVSKKPIKVNICYTTINPSSSIHKHLSQGHREHTSLCPSKISRPSVSNIPQPFGMPVMSNVALEGTLHEGRSSILTASSSLRNS